MAMRQAIRRLEVPTRGVGLYDCTRELDAFVREQAIGEGLLTVFIQHTSASLTIQENADPDVLRDLTDFLRRLVPEDERLYRHTAEGPDDMPAHIRAALTQTQLAIPISGGRLLLGTWQAVYVFEHRSARFTRTVVLHVVGE